MIAAAAILESARDAWSPPSDLTVSQFADAELIVATGPLAGTSWSTSFAPYQRGIMDAFHEDGVELVIVRTSAQVGKTALAIAVLGYHIAQDPCPALAVLPTVDPMARDFARNRLDPVIASSPVLRAAVSKRISRSASNATLSKTFKGGSLSIGGANSASSLASRSVRLLLLDEIDRYPSELPGEGSTLSIALKRTTAYLGRRRILMTSTPTLKGAPIDSWFRRGDQRRFYVPCPDCGHFHTWAFRNLRWEARDPSSARLHCPACDYPITEGDRLAVLSEGEWRAEAPNREERNIVSFALWEAYSPFSKLSEIVAQFLAADDARKGGDDAPLHTWTNTVLGEALEPAAGEGVEPHVVLSRVEEYEAQVPAGVSALTMGVDTQDNRLEALVWGWGPGEESWLVDRQELQGDTSQSGVWARLTELAARTWAHASGHRVPLIAVAIDSAGHRTDQVYQWVAGQVANGRRGTFATIGRAGQRPIVSKPSRKHWGRQPRPVDLFTIGVDAAKQLFMSRLQVEDAGPGFVHLPTADWADDDLARQLTAERLVTRYSKGVPIQEWRPVSRGQRNEALDCTVLALAALRLSRVDLVLMADRLAKAPAPKAKPAPRPPNQPPAREPWMGRRLRGDPWLKRRR